jgi:ribosomal protein L20A (L18A)
MVRVYMVILFVVNLIIDQNKYLKSQINDISGILLAERKEAQEYANRALARQIEAKKKDEVLEKLYNCIADKSCAPRVRVKQSCPSVPNTASSSSGINAAPPGFAEIDGQDYYRLIEAQKKAIWMIESLQKELLARSTADYCQPKSASLP